jgi:hypothetical protein
METYVQLASVGALEIDDRQSPEFNFGAVLRAKPRNDLNAVRHDCNWAADQPLSSAVQSK